VRKLIVPISVLVVILAMLAFSMTYTVRFTEVAVKTRFGSAVEIRENPGLGFKLPYPVESVTTYDRRTRLVIARSETQQTADDFQIIVESYLTYRVTDPLKFFSSFSNAGDRSEDHYRKAEDDVLRDLLRSALGETSKFKMGDLFSSVAGESRLPELEQSVLATLNGTTEGAKPMGDYGIEVTTVGVSRIILPEETTNSVIARMGANRDRLAERYESEGRSQARAIEAEALSQAAKIRAFAERRADEILAKGEAEAAPYLAMQNVNPDLAVFIQNIRLMQDAMAKKFTLVFSADDYGMQVFNPNVLQNSEGTLPVPNQVRTGAEQQSDGSED
jgi:membrane protease subunit HflC